MPTPVLATSQSYHLSCRPQGNPLYQQPCPHATTSCRWVAPPQCTSLQECGSWHPSHPRHVSGSPEAFLTASVRTLLSRITRPRSPVGEVRTSCTKATHVSPLSGTAFGADGDDSVCSGGPRPRFRGRECGQWMLFLHCAGMRSHHVSCWVPGGGTYGTDIWRLCCNRRFIFWWHPVATWGVTQALSMYGTLHRGYVRSQ